MDGTSGEGLSDDENNQLQRILKVRRGDYTDTTERSDPFLDQLMQAQADAEEELTTLAGLFLIMLMTGDEMTRKEFRRAVGLPARTTLDRAIAQLREIDAISERPHPDDGRKILYRAPDPWDEQ